MKLDPGPIPVILAGDDQLQPEAPGFGDLATSELGQLPSMESDMDDALAVLSALQDVDVAASVDEDLAGVVEEMLVDRGRFDDGAWEDFASSYDAADEAILTAYAVVPGEAFQPLPPAYGVPADNSQVGIPNLGDVTLSNLERPDSPNFLEGEHYAVTAVITPNSAGGGIYAKVEIVADVHFNGQDLARRSFGFTDAYGHLRYQGQWTAADKGDWRLSFWEEAPEGGELANRTVFFQVFSADTAIGGVTVDFSNTTTGDASLFHTNAPQAGDAWRLVIQGPPNSPVRSIGSIAGVPYAETQIGMTDDNGVLTLEGVVSAGEEGQWVERYNIAGQWWPGQVVFQVVP